MRTLRNFIHLSVIDTLWLDRRLRSVINCGAINVVILAACAEDMNHVFDGWFTPSPLQVCLTCHEFDELRNKSQTHDHCS